MRERGGSLGDEVRGEVTVYGISRSEAMGGKGDDGVSGDVACMLNQLN